MVDIRRSRLGFEGNFTQIPNQWLRDDRMSRKARGLLAEILSHSTGWVITEASLIAAGSEGRDSIRSGLQELEECGYLVRGQERSESGTFAAATMELVDPWTDNPQAVSGSPVDGLSVDGLSAPHIRRTIPKNTNSQEHQENTNGESVEKLDVSGLFESWWQAYPRKVGKKAAERAFAKAVRSLGGDHAAVQTVCAGLGRARDVWQRSGTESRFIPHPSTWLNEGRWDDAEPEAPARPLTAAERMMNQLNRGDDRNAIGQ